MQVVEQFFELLTGRDWGRLGAVLDRGVVRIGPFGDRVDGRDTYLAFLRRAVPSEYANDVRRIVASPDGRCAFATVSEHLRYGDEVHDLDEAYFFEIGGDGCITRIEVYWQTPERDPGGFGSASGREGTKSDGEGETRR